MKNRLDNIAGIQTGIFSKTVSKGDIVYLQVKHFDEFGVLGSVLHPDLEYDSVTQKHLLKPGDVLFAAKGTKNFAAVYESHNPPAVASTSFFVIRLKVDNVLPDYLAWKLNHPVTQNYLKRNAIGSAIVSISKAVLDELEISIPDLTTQRTILKIAELRKKEKQLKQQIETLKENQIQYQILNALK